MKVPGVLQVVRLENAVAVVARNTWAAQQGLAALAVRWNDGPNATLSTGEIERELAAASLREGVVARSEGDVEDAMESAARRMEAVYELPLLAHATMEPMNCTVHVRADGCDAWLGTQVPTFAQNAVAAATGLPKESVRIHNQLLGGGFGRRLEVDYVDQAARVARQVDGPVQVSWSREEDMQHDMYRPCYHHRISVGVDNAGRPMAWTHRVTGASIVDRVVNELYPKNLRVLRAAGLGQLWAAIRGIDSDAVEGAVEPPYMLPNLRVEYVRCEPSAIPTAFWRGVGPTSNAFVVESFIDELAVAAGTDPFEYRRALLGAAPRARNVLELAAKQSNWGTPMPPGSGRGIAVLHAFGSYLAQVAEVSVDDAGNVRVQRIVCVVDCGTIVNPDTVVAQMQGGIVFGLSAALWGEITVKNGRVEQGNFHDYRVLRASEAPVIDVHLVRNGAAPGGVGEPGTSLVFPALANAIFAATGKRIRRLPVGTQLKA